MPDQRQHRGRHPEDDRLFAPDHWPALRAAVADLLPQLQRRLSPRDTLSQLGWLGTGLGVVLAATRVLHH